MFKRLLLIIVFLLFSVNCFAADYWIYIRTYDRTETELLGTGRSKKGDIVQILPCNEQNIPSETEKKEWAIIKMSNLSTKDIAKYTSPWREEIAKNEYENKAYRRYKLDVDTLKIKVGLDETLKNKSIIDKNLSLKTNSNLITYAMDNLKYLALVKPVKQIDNTLVPYLHAEVVSTINKTGEDYNTLTLWEDAKDGDLVTGTRQETAECYNDDGVLDDRLGIDGSTTNSTYYMKVTVPIVERHDGTAGSGFCITPSGYISNNGGVIMLVDTYSVLEWVEITGWQGQYGGSYDGVSCSNNLQCTVRNCLIHDDIDTTTTANIRGISLANNHTITNNIIYNIGDEGIKQTENNSISKYIYNNTVYNYNEDNGGATGIYGAGSGDVIKNNLVIAGTNGGNCFSFNGGSHNYNASSDATATGTNSLDSGDASPPNTSDFESVTGGSEDLHLSSGAVEINKGFDLGTIANIDIDNRDRNAKGDIWDIGADEEATGTGVSFTPIIIIY